MEATASSLAVGRISELDVVAPKKTATRIILILSLWLRVANF